MAEGKAFLSDSHLSDQDTAEVCSCSAQLLLSLKSAGALELIELASESGPSFNSLPVLIESHVYVHTIEREYVAVP